jgi:CSLREA domain-containing protein
MLRAHPAQAAATITVNTTADDSTTNGNCTLREAITATESNTSQDQCIHDGSLGTDSIHFNIPGSGPHTIQPATFLPVINAPVIIDATSEPDFVSSPVVVLNGNGGNASAFTIQGGGTTIRGFAIGNFGQPGIGLSSGDGNTIAGNYIGLGADGTTVMGNGFLNPGGGVQICCGSDGNTIGGASASDRNVIAGNSSQAVSIHTSNNVVHGNYLGTNATATAKVPGTWGVTVASGSGNEIGGGGAGEGNVITATQSGVLLSGTASDNVLAGNRIGVGPTGNPLPIQRAVVVAGSNATDNLIGGAGAGEGNIIASSQLEGIQIESAAGNAIQGNSIHSNGSLGIDLGFGTVSPNDVDDPDSGPNNLQNYPVLNSAVPDGSGGVLVRYTLNSVPSTSYRVEMFLNQSCNAPDPNDHGEGEVFLAGFAVPTNAGGDHSGTVSIGAPPTVELGDVITATATRLDGGNNPIETSEFSECETVVPETFHVTRTDDPSVDGCPIGDCSMREAITAANAAPGTNTILFDVSGPIQPTSALPIVSQPVNIDGTSDPDSTHVEIDGGGTTSAHGLRIQGGSSTLTGLVINDFDFDAVRLEIGDGNTIQGNLLGLNAAGTAAGPGNAVGIGIDAASNGNTVGGTGAGQGNVISGNGQGISITNGSTNGLLGNKIGTNASGTAAVPNGTGVAISSGTGLPSNNNAIGTSASGAGNLISGNTGDGVLLTGPETAGTSIHGNAIGVNEAGGAALPNGGDGIDLLRTNNGPPQLANTTIGGSAAGAGNVISGNAGNGIRLEGRGVSVVTIRNNTIGLGEDGTTDLGNGADGIFASDLAAGTLTIGGSGASEGNVISGNGEHGLDLRSIPSSTIQGNRVGTNAGGTAAVANAGGGMSVGANPDATIGGANGTPGGACSGPCNLVSGNTGVGMFLTGTALVQGNYVGTNLAGTAALPNTGHGICECSTDTRVITIGGTMAGHRNVVAGNGGSGIAFNDLGARNNIIVGNSIGVGSTGGALGNTGAGLRIIGDGNTVGGTAVGEGNIIANNGDDGIFVSEGASGTRILGNSIRGNAGEGIDHRGDGVTANDPGDTDAGTLSPPVSDLQNFPAWAGAFTANGKTLVTGTLDSAPSTTYRVELFTNPACDTSGNGEGATFLDSVPVVTPGSGLVGVHHLMNQVVTDKVAATATDMTAAVDAADRGETSEFSACLTVEPDTIAPPNPSITASPTPGSWTNDTTVELDWATPVDTADDNAPGSGLDGYSFEWSTSASTVPDQTIDLEETVTSVDETLPEGQRWFHIRTVDRLGNWSDTLHFGPFQIDTSAPSAVSNLEASPAAGGWTNDPTVDVMWDEATDANGIAGYSFEWDTTPTTQPNTTPEGDETTLSDAETLSDGSSHWFHVRAVDEAGNGSTTEHLGPFQIDTVDPSAQMTGPAQAFTLDGSFPVTWSGSDAASGVEGYEVTRRQASHTGGLGAGTVFASGPGTAQSQSASPGTTYCYSVAATDEAGNTSSPSAERCTAVPLDDTAFTRKKFAAKSMPGAYLNTAAVGKKKKASLTLNGVQADRLVLIVSKCPKCGALKVSFAGTTMKVNTNGPKQQQVMVPIADFATAQTGTVQIVKPKKKGVVIVEGLGISAV